MIFVTRLDGTEFALNCDHIVTIERTPDTVITLTTGDRYMVKESVEEVIERTIGYRHRVLEGPGSRTAGTDWLVSALDLVRKEQRAAEGEPPPKPKEAKEEV